MKVLIIEDEMHASRKLERQLRNLDPAINIVDKIQTVDEAINWLGKNEADLIFLDIHLGDALSFDIFDKIKVSTPIIFTTAYDQYAIRAFKLNSIDYLLKPVKSDELAVALAKFKERSISQSTLDYRLLAELIKKEEEDQEAYQKRFMVYRGEKIITIQVEEALYFFAEGKYCYLVSKEGKEYLIDYTLDKLNKILNPEYFFRINRQYIISLDSINNMYSYPKGRVKIQLISPKMEEVIVSIERSPEFKKWLNR